ncbi:MAG: type II secretion system protein [Clostridia bacterium]
MEQKRMQKNSKGITLIALVITIIVLLILAGVTIATLTGDNGILTQAGKAKDKTTEAESIERVQVEVAGSYGLDGTIDKDQLNKNLGNIAGLKIGESNFGGENIVKELPATVTLNGYDIGIDANGGVEKIPEIIAKIRANPQAYYGKKVTNYKASDSDTNTYRIFYVDKDNDFKDGYNTIYLKADFSGSVHCSTSYDASQTLIKRMNPLWATKENTVAAETTTISNKNEQAAAWLCDPSKWTAYCDTDKANYAIGGPSVEMYVKSYNQTHGDDALGCQYQTNTVPGYIYKVKDTIQNSGWYTNDNTLDYSMTYKSMYCGQNGKRTGSWWLASPSAHSSISVCDVGGSNARLYGNNYYYDDVVSPLVSLKSSFIPEIEE